MTSEKQGCEFVANWWNDKSIPVWRIGDKILALYGWNGEKYMDCWAAQRNGMLETNDNSRYVVRPLYGPEEDDFPIIGYEWDYA